MAGRLTRFLNLERPRKPDDTPAHGVATRARFTGEEPPAASPDEMFRAERETQLQSGVEIDTTDAAEQPFLRCPVCEADNSKFAVKCINCQSRLDSDDVRAWNARLWQARRAARVLEQQPPPQVLLERNRLLGESIAQEVAEHERLRMNWTEPGNSTPLGMRLLELIPNQNARFAVALALVGTFFGAGTLAYVERNHPVLQTVAIVVAISLLVLFTPNRRRRGFWSDD